MVGLRSALKQPPIDPTLEFCRYPTMFLWLLRGGSLGRLPKNGNWASRSELRTKPAGCRQKAGCERMSLAHPAVSRFLGAKGTLVTHPPCVQVDILS